MFEDIFCWHTYLVKNFEVFVCLKTGNLVNSLNSVKCHQRRGPRGEAVRRQRGCPPGSGVQRWMNCTRDSAGSWGGGVGGGSGESSRDVGYRTG